MGLNLPAYPYNPGGQFAARSIPNVYCWFVSFSQQFRKKPFHQDCKAMIYDSKANFVADFPPIEIVEISCNDMDDCYATIYGHYPTWTVPSAPDPVTQTTGPILLGSHKYMTAFLLRNHPVFAQTGATWD